MNQFYHIVEPNEPLPNTFVLENTLKTSVMPMVIHFRHHERRQRDTYNNRDKSYPRTSDDFDKDVAYKIIKFKPPYEVYTLLDYHLDYYITTNNGDKQLFIKHIEYVVVEILKKIGNSDVYVTLIQDWIATHQTYKPLNTQSFMNIQNNGDGNTIIADVKSSTIAINTTANHADSIKELQTSIALLNTELDTIKKYLTYDDYEILTDDLSTINKELARPNANVSKIKSLLLSIPNLLNAIPIDKITKAIEMIAKVSNLF